LQQRWLGRRILIVKRRDRLVLQFLTVFICRRGALQ